MTIGNLLLTNFVILIAAGPVESHASAKDIHCLLGVYKEVWSRWKRLNKRHQPKNAFSDLYVIAVSQIVYEETFVDLSE